MLVVSAFVVRLCFGKHALTNDGLVLVSGPLPIFDLSVQVMSVVFVCACSGLQLAHAPPRMALVAIFFGLNVTGTISWLTETVQMRVFLRIT